MQSNPNDRTLAAWLKKDEKSLLSGLKSGLDVFELGLDLNREPLSVLAHCDELGLFEFDAGSEEEAEFVGLALSGVPLGQVIPWCLAEPGRTRDLESLMKIGDMRPALHFARERGIALVRAESLDDLFWVMEQPVEQIDAAIRSLGHRFDVLTPRTLREQLSGQVEVLCKDLAFPPVLRPTCGQWLPRKGRSSKGAAPRRARRRKSTPTTSRAPRKAWSGRRKARA